VKEWGSSRTRIEQFVESNLDARIDARVAPRHLKEDAINAARLTLSVCWFDVSECAEGLKALRIYRKEWDEEKGIWRDRPRHDAASHGADAFQTLSVWWREMREEEPPENLEAKTRRQHAEHAEAMEKALKPAKGIVCPKVSWGRRPRRVPLGLAALSIGICSLCSEPASANLFWACKWQLVRHPSWVESELTTCSV
jgi:hypothetical protein